MDAHTIKHKGVVSERMLLEEPAEVKKTNMLDPLDALRAFAVLMVFLLHAALFSGLPPTKDMFIFYLPAWAGVWILFILSGYLIGSGFKTGRYKNTIDYLKKKVVRICVPYYVFMFIVLLLLSPGLAINDPITILRILTFTYNGMPGEVGYGLVWFISTLMQFYIISIFFDMLVRRINKNRYACTVLFILLLLSGLILRQILYDAGSDWVKFVYTLSLTNLDIFFCGFLLNWMFDKEKEPKAKNIRRKNILAPVSIVLLLSSVLFFAYCQVASDPGLSIFYMYRGQTLMILIICFFIYCLDRSVREHNEKLSLNAIKKNPLRIVECFAVISLGFYLWHSVILYKTVSVFHPHPTITDHLITLAVAGVLSILMAAIFYYSVEKWSARMLGRSKE